MIDVLTAELRAPITEETAELYVGGTVFKTGPPEQVGVELEWLVQDADRPRDPVRPERLTEALAEEFDPPLAGQLTFEPGGQLELSSPPAPLAGCIAGAAADLDRVRARAAAAGLILTGLGLDPRPPVLRTAVPRYVAMAQHFARRGPEGRTMMCSTASVQVCLDAGADDTDVAERWHALHAWLPVLTGLFANSPAPGRRCGRTGGLGGDRPDPDGRAARRRPARGVRAVGAGRAAAGDPPGGGVLGGAGRPELPRLAARRRPRARAGRAHLGRPGLPPEHAVPAGAGPRPPGAAGDRRAARRRLAGGGRPGRGAARRSRARAATAAAAEATVALGDPPPAGGGLPAASTDRAPLGGLPRGARPRGPTGRRRLGRPGDERGGAGRDDRPGPAAGRDDVRGDGGRRVDPRRPAGAGNRGGGVRRAVSRSAPVPRRRQCDRT